ncbi:uncharacterized protein [Epargyreus clarus]|uniref:uncharacterized protein isoform X3 n=1 Tax=Epargyreus clarus TaxID=520877 RepID=UPI003C2EA6C6
MPLPFNKILDQKLIKLVRDNPALYHPKHPNYMDFDAREVAWQKIGDSLNRSVIVCKARWLNIRDMMRKKWRKRLRNPSQPSSRYKYEDDLEFMINIFNESAAAADGDEESGMWPEVASESFGDDSDYDNSGDVKPNISSCKTKNTQERVSNESSYKDINPADPLDVFLLAIGTTLRRLSPYYLNQAKTKIFQVVQDYELKQIMSNEDPTPGNSDNNT